MTFSVRFSQVGHKVLLKKNLTSLILELLALKVFHNIKRISTAQF